MIIREIQPKDDSSVAKMIRNVFLEYNAQQEGTVHSDPTTDHLSTTFDVKDAILFVAEENGIIEGCCGIFPTKGLPMGYIEIVKFYVSNAIRGKGIGKQLFQLCEAAAIDFGYQQLYLESMDDFSEAVRIYEKIGFNRIQKPLGNTGHFGCDIWMTKNLNA